MMPNTLAAFLIAACASAARAQDAPVPEECLAKGKDKTAVTVSHGGKNYRMANEACRAQFLSDPERFAQLYDALLELEAEGTPLRAPSAPSLVPS
jgi:YHS domain-containing protein